MLPELPATRCWRKGPGGRRSHRASASIVPTGSVSAAGRRVDGLQVNLPFSKQHGDCLLALERRLHVAARAEAQPRARSCDLSRRSSPAARSTALRPMFHLMLESVLLFERSYDGDRTSRADTLVHAVARRARRLEHRRGRADRSSARRSRSRGPAASHRRRRVPLFLVRAAVQEMTVACARVQEQRVRSRICGLASSSRVRLYDANDDGVSQTRTATMSTPSSRPLSKSASRSARRSDCSRAGRSARRAPAAARPADRRGAGSSCDRARDRSSL